MTATSRHARALIRDGRHTGPTAGVASEFAQANLVVVPRTLASVFQQFCEHNPRACPLLERLDPGQVEPSCSAPGADVRTDAPRYWIFRHGGRQAEVADLLEIWTPDLVTFLLGCSFTFESALRRLGVELPHWQPGRNVAMYDTTIPTRAVPPLHGPTVVSMRWIPLDLIDAVYKATQRHPDAHGVPLHLGDPRDIGIADLDHPTYGDPWPAPPNHEPAFWACGVTAAAVARQSGVPLMITHAPGHMFITDLPAAR